MQETKWFLEEVYGDDDNIVIATGRATPGERKVRYRGEGITIILCGPSLVAWRAGGSCWKAWSSTLVFASLLVGGDHLNIMSCCVSMYAASKEEDEFYNILQ